jgi:hypothetical protein
MLTFDQTLDLLHAWMGRSVSRWVNSSHDTVIYIVGTLARGEAQCPRFGEDVAATLKSHSSFICARVIAASSSVPDFIQADLDEKSTI